MQTPKKPNTADRVTKEETKQQHTQQAEDAVSGASDRIAELEAAVVAAQESERRALADYQNLVRRNQEERVSFVKFATKELVGNLLEPLTHLEMAAAQINDTGLNMVISQFWQKLEESGLQKVDVMGKPFDVEVMEAADKKGSGEVVVAVHRPAFTFNGEVIQHARVVMGDKK